MTLIPDRVLTGLNLWNKKSIASIHFPNESAVDVAKIEGGPAYKQMMRATGVLDECATAHCTSLDDNAAWKPGTGAAAQAALGLQFLRDYLPPWLGGNDDRCPQSLSGMLKALKTATESYLQASLSTAEVVVPFPVAECFLDALRAACSSLSLQMPLSAQPPAGILAARAHGIGGNCNTGDDEPAQLILTVDYSRAALTALLVAEECGIFEVRRVLHDTRLGADALSRGSDAPGFNSSRGDLASALRDITRLPVKDGNGEEVTLVGELVLLGESAGDRRLHDVLKEVLGEQSGSPVTTVSDGRRRIIDPLFAASRGVAQDCWSRMKFRPDDEHSGPL